MENNSKTINSFFLKFTLRFISKFTSNRFYLEKVTYLQRIFKKLKQHPHFHKLFFGINLHIQPKKQFIQYISSINKFHQLNTLLPNFTKSNRNGDLNSIFGVQHQYHTNIISPRIFLKNQRFSKKNLVNLSLKRDSVLYQYSKLFNLYNNSLGFDRIILKRSSFRRWSLFLPKFNTKNCNNYLFSKFFNTIFIKTKKFTMNSRM